MTGRVFAIVLCVCAVIFIMVQNSSDDEVGKHISEVLRPRGQLGHVEIPKSSVQDVESSAKMVTQQSDAIHVVKQFVAGFMEIDVELMRSHMTADFEKALFRGMARAELIEQVESELRKYVFVDYRKFKYALIGDSPSNKSVNVMFDEHRIFEMTVALDEMQAWKVSGLFSKIGQINASLRKQEQDRIARHSPANDQLTDEQISFKDKIRQGEEGDRFKISFEGVQLTGTAHFYFNDGKTMTAVPFKNGQWHGDVKYFRPDGSLKLKETYTDGILIASNLISPDQTYITRFFAGKKNIQKNYYSAKGKLLKIEILNQDDNYDVIFDEELELDLRFEYPDLK